MNRFVVYLLYIIWLKYGEKNGQAKISPHFHNLNMENKINSAKCLQLQFKVKINEEEKITVSNIHSKWINKHCDNNIHTEKEISYKTTPFRSMWWGFVIRKLIQKVSNIQTYSDRVWSVFRWNIRQFHFEMCGLVGFRLGACDASHL